MQGDLDDIDVLPVRCPQCGECQNSLPHGGNPLAAGTEITCMVCGYVFDAMEYRRLLVERQKEFQPLRVGQLR